VTLAVYDICGRRVASLSNGALEPGSHAVTWSRGTEHGDVAGAGVYFVRMTASSLTRERRFSSVGKMILLK